MVNKKNAVTARNSQKAFHAMNMNNRCQTRSEIWHPPNLAVYSPSPPESCITITSSIRIRRAWAWPHCRRRTSSTARGTWRARRAARAPRQRRPPGGRARLPPSAADPRPAVGAPCGRSAPHERHRITPSESTSAYECHITCTSVRYYSSTSLRNGTLGTRSSRRRQTLPSEPREKIAFPSSHLLVRVHVLYSINYLFTHKCKRRVI